MLSLTKQFLKLEEDYKHEDELIEHFISTAKEYIYNSTGKKFDKEISIHKTVVLLLAENWYENRNVAVTNELDRTLTSMLLQAGLIKK